jgi:hypothetical protein
MVEVWSARLVYATSVGQVASASRPRPYRCKFWTIRNVDGCLLPALVQALETMNVDSMIIIVGVDGMSRWRAN